jgi:hypothetical protein
VLSLANGNLKDAPEWLEMKGHNPMFASLFSRLYDVYSCTKSTMLHGISWTVVEIVCPWVVLAHLLILLFLIRLFILVSNAIGSRLGPS